jgi:hypothetical protein
MGEGRKVFPYLPSRCILKCENFLAKAICRVMPLYHSVRLSCILLHRAQNSAAFKGLNGADPPTGTLSVRV